MRQVGMTVLAALAILLIGFSYASWLRYDPAPGQAAYVWSKNFAIAAPQDGKQEVEPSLAADANGHIWLTYLDADYVQAWTRQWIAWPRRLTLRESEDGGKSFSPPRILAETSDNASLAVNSLGQVLGSWVKYTVDSKYQLQQKIIVSKIGDTDAPPIETCLPWSSGVRQDQSNITIGENGTIHLVGGDIGSLPLAKGPQLLYARSTNQLKSCIDQQSLPAVGQLPQIVAAKTYVMIVGATGFYVSRDDGASFGPKHEMDFGNMVAKATVSFDRQTVYVLGDSISGGLWLHITSDGGQNWRDLRVDNGARAVSWRFPAVAADRSGRVHLAWMDNHDGAGALYYAETDETAHKIAGEWKVSDAPFPFSWGMPPPPPATEDGRWVGNSLGIAIVGDKTILAWCDQRDGIPRSAIYLSIGARN